MPMKRLLHDLPSAGSFEQSEDVGHVDVRSRQFAGPSGHFEMRYRQRLKNVHAGDTRLDTFSRPVSIYPVEEEFRPTRQLVADKTKKGRARMESRPHNRASALLATIKVELEHIDDGIVIRNVEWNLCHGWQVGAGQAKTVMAKDGQ